MNASYVIAMDVHSHSSHVVTLTPTGRRRDERTLPTSIPALRELVQATPRPRRVVFEEGPLAGWLYRNLHADVEEAIVADPRRNAYITKDGDKDDPIDAFKLGRLLQGGFIRPVHHAVEAPRASFKELTLFYRQCVSQRVARANRVIWAVRGYGVVIREKDFTRAADRSAVLARLPRQKVLRLRVQMLWADYDQALAHEQRSEQELIRRARRIVMVRRFTALPGVGWIRAATFYALIDTPFRFRSKSALWRYMGIGLQRRTSGAGRTQLKTTPACNHALKDIILGAAKDAVNLCEDNPFTQIHRRQLEHGNSPRIARRTVARAMAAVMWGMFKSHTTYRPDQVGASVREPSAQHMGEH